LLVIGAILTFSGVNIPLGIALMVVGAAGLATVVAVNWDTISKALQGPIGVITALVSAALLVLGAIILFSGTNIPLGLGLMIAGAVGLAATVAANWNTVQELLQGPLGIVAGLVSAAVLVLGAIFTFSGTHIPLGIALMAVGAAGLVTVLAVNWETMKGILQGPIGVLTGIISAALLVLGAILVFSGVGIPLGIGLMAAGAIGLATAIAANWDFLTDMLGGKLNTILTIIYAATLVLGIILLCTGAGIPLGLGLIIASAAGLVQTITPHWDYILEKLQGIWKSISDWWNNTVAPKLKALKNFFVDNIINPVLGFFEGFINKIIDGLNWLIRMINKISFDVPDWVPGIGGKKLGFNIPTVSYVSIPRLAQGAVIPPNREFAAVLGDQTNGNNLEAPEDLIRQIVREESGSSEMVSLLQAILEATKAGHVMKVDKKVLARTAADGINDITLSSGKPALVF
jgi:hypothetical protein